MKSNQMKRGDEPARAKAIPRTITFNFRGDMRDVATLVHIYEDLLGFKIPSKSTLIRVAITDFRKLLMEHVEGAEYIESTAEAYRFLLQRGLMAESETLLKKSRTDKMVGEGETIGTIGVNLPEGLEEALEKAMKGDDPAIAKRAEELSQVGKEEKEDE